MGSFHGWEILLVILLAFLIFGPKRLPELARSIGEGIREFKKALSSRQEDPATPPAGMAETPERPDGKG